MVRVWESIVAGPIGYRELGSLIVKESKQEERTAKEREYGEWVLEREREIEVGDGRTTILDSIYRQK